MPLLKLHLNESSKSTSSTFYLHKIRHERDTIKDCFNLLRSEWKFDLYAWIKFQFYFLHICNWNGSRCVHYDLGKICTRIQMRIIEIAIHTNNGKCNAVHDSNHRMIYGHRCVFPILTLTPIREFNIWDFMVTSAKTTTFSLFAINYLNHSII